MAVKAKESRQVEKLRRKLKTQMAEEHKKINKKALEQMRITMKRWIQRHAGERINLLNKTFTLFDENKHPATSQDQYIASVAKRLKHKAFKTDLEYR